MKKLITLLLFVVTISSNAQITFENNYPTAAANVNYLRLVNLSSSGYKYAINDKTKIILYNLNHTVFKTINFPALTGGITSIPQVCYISEELFNTNPADIEYFIFYTDTSGSYIAHSAVVDELGNILFSKDTTNLLGIAHYGNEDFISYTPNGVKMIISSAHGGHDALVYSLPGTLPCHDCNGGTTSSRTTATGSLNNGITNYPNPAKNETTVAYDLPHGVTTADLVFYNITGQEVKRFKVTNAFKDILISTADLDAGTYYYQLQAAGVTGAGKKMIVIK